MNYFAEFLPLIILVIVIVVPLAIVIFTVRRMKRRGASDQINGSNDFPKGKR